MISVETRPYAKPEAAGRRLLEIAGTIETTSNGWVYVEKVNGPFLFQDKASPAEYGAGINWLIGQGMIQMHDGGAYFLLTDKAAQVFA